MPERLLVIQTEHLDATVAAWLAERCELVVCPQEDERRFGELLARAAGLVIRTYTRVNTDLLGRAPALKVVGRAGVGLDNVDLAACAAAGVTVVHTPAANTRAVVEYVFALLLDVVRPRTTLDAAVDVKTWKHLRAGLIAPRELAGLTLGIVGFGRIGSQVARVGEALEMRVLYNDLIDIPPERRGGATPAPLETLLRESDVISIHVDERPANRDLFADAEFARCRPDVVLINASRGFVVSAPALAAFLKSNPHARAALDVHEPEPFGSDYPLLGLPNVRLSPHLAAATAQAHANMSWVVRDVWRVLTGETPEFAARPGA